jgi:hypothetical protein
MIKVPTQRQEGAVFDLCQMRLGFSGNELVGRLLSHAHGVAVLQQSPNLPNLQSDQILVVYSTYL